MRDTRTGTAGRASHQKPHLQYLAYRAAQSRGHSGTSGIVAPGNRHSPKRDYPGDKWSGPGYKKQSIRKIAQDLLTSAGLSGAAHPIRRLQHPGGRMEVPLGGSWRASPLEEAAAKEAEWGKTLEAARNYHPPEPGTRKDLLHGASLKALLFAGSKFGLPLAAAGLYGRERLKPTEEDRWIHKVTKEFAEDSNARGSYNSAVDFLAHTKQITPSQAQQAHRWAMTAGTDELRARRAYIGRRFKNVPPPSYRTKDWK